MRINNLTAKLSFYSLNIFISITRLFSSKLTNKVNIITTALALVVVTAPDKALAACDPPATSGKTTTCGNLSVQTDTVGTGPGLNDVNLLALSAARIDTGESTAISLDSGSTIVLRERAVVQNNTQGLSGAGAWGLGHNTIEFNNNTRLTLEPGAQILGLGSSPTNDAITAVGSGNTIVNHGLIQGSGRSAIWFESADPDAGANVIDNYGTITSLDPAKTVIGGSGAPLSLTNHTGAVIVGNIAFGPGNDSLTLEGGSTLTGNINGGDGANALILNGAAVSPARADLLSGDISDFQSLTKNGDGEWRLTGNIDNSGSVAPMRVTVNDGTLTLTGDNAYAGDTVINGGTLAAGALKAFSGQSTYTVAPAGTMNLMGFDQTILSLDNAGTINLNGDGGTVLNVTGNYVGDNGQLNFNARLSDDDTHTEKLMVGGDTSGSTRVSVNNAGGSGAATVKGIELISVAGASDGEFLQSGRIVAGAYDYTLERGTGINAANWYLNSSTDDPHPGPGPSPDPIPGPEPELVERPEAGSYAANLAAANTLFANRLEDRQGMTRHVDAPTSADQTTSLWMINQGGHNRSRDDGGQLRTQSNRYALQLGGDIGRWNGGGLDSFQLGVMAGYGNAKSNTGSRVSGYSAKGTVDGYSVGIYATWYANATDKTGLYVDGWTQYGWFDNKVEGRDLKDEEYNSKGASASLESGYALKLGENAAKNTAYFLQPQAQVIWMGVKADDHTEANGTRVSSEGDGNIQTRLGIKAYMHTYSERDKEQDRAFQPFIEANWIHNSDDFGVSMDGITIKQDGAANIGELKLGVEGQINRHFNLWGNVAQQVGDKGYSDTAGMLGVKYLF